MKCSECAGTDHDKPSQVDDSCHETLKARVADLENDLRSLLDYAEHGDITGRGCSIHQVKADARETLNRK